MKTIVTNKSKLIELVDVTKGGLGDSDFKRLQGKIESMRVPLYMWLDKIEWGSLEQYLNIANMPIAFHHVSAMPDSHEGYGMPIGGICALGGGRYLYISPYMVGSDIGCGMIFIPLGVYDIPKDVLKKIRADIIRAIPMGKGKIKKKGYAKDMPEFEGHHDCGVVDDEWSNASRSLGSLGSGNHFIEFQKDVDTGEFGVMLHSGSRNLGSKVCQHYNKIAVELNERYHSVVPKNHQLAFLSMGSEEGKTYFDEMNFCVDYALRNRTLMLETITEIITDYIDADIDFRKVINIAHNYASIENHFGKNVMVHRKGATLARKDTMGIIPGSLGSNSFIVRGLGNRDSFESCSHGAGRPMSRGDAKKKLNLEEEKKKLEAKGVIYDLKQSGLDESVGAYKDIDEVMENQSDLMGIVREMRPIMPIKGNEKK